MIWQGLQEERRQVGRVETRETIEKKVEIVVIVLLTISHDGVVRNVSVQWWKDLNAVTHVDWVLIAQNVLRYTVVFVGMFFPKAAVSRRNEKETTWKSLFNVKDNLKEPDSRMRKRHTSHSTIL